MDVSATSPDKNTNIEIGQYDENKQIQLNHGTTAVKVVVTSPDRSSHVTYSISVQREKFVFPLSLKNNNTICSICLAVPHCPVSIVDTPEKHTFCNSCLQTVTRTNKKDPITNAPLGGNNFYIPENEIENGISGQSVTCLFGCGESVALCQFGNHVKNKCEQKMMLNGKASLVVFGKHSQDEEYVCILTL